MKKYAVHKLYGASGSESLQQVVIVVEDGRFHGFFPLKEELAFTEWRGGVAILSGRDSIDIQLPASWDSILSYLLEEEGRNLWHINGKDYSLRVVHHIERLL